MDEEIANDCPIIVCKQKIVKEYQQKICELKKELNNLYLFPLSDKKEKRVIKNKTQLISGLIDSFEYHINYQKKCIKEIVIRGE